MTVRNRGCWELLGRDGIWRPVPPDHPEVAAARATPPPIVAVAEARRVPRTPRRRRAVPPEEAAFLLGALRSTNGRWRFRIEGRELTLGEMALRMKVIFRRGDARLKVRSYYRQLDAVLLAAGHRVEPYASRRFQGRDPARVGKVPEELKGE